MGFILTLFVLLSVDPEPLDLAVLQSLYTDYHAAVSRKVRSRSRNVGSVNIFAKCRRGKSFSFDRHGDRYMSRPAKVGKAYVVADVKVIRSDGINQIPALCAHSFDSAGGVEFIGIMEPRYYRWRSHGSYIGLYADFSNDFEYARAVRFSYGIMVDSNIDVVVSHCGFSLPRRRQNGTPDFTYVNDITYIDRASSVFGVGEVVCNSRSH